jgi:hypothetical protein
VARTPSSAMEADDSLGGGRTDSRQVNHRPGAAFWHWGEKGKDFPTLGSDVPVTSPNYQRPNTPTEMSSTILFATG